MQKSLIRKGLVLGIIILFIVASVIPSIAGIVIEKQVSIGNTLRGNILYVGGSGPGNYSKIQDAIDDSYNGDTVFVYDDSSPYNEQIWIYKSINLVGEDKSNTIIYDNNPNNVSGVIYVAVNSVTIKDFTINTNGRYNPGIEIDSNFNTIINLIISSNYTGILLYTASSNDISWITSSNNPVGIHIAYSSNNTITNCNIINSATYGLKIQVGGSSNDNLIYHNNFLNNTINALDYGSNTWDNGYPSGGNFWDDYIGNDDDGDGIGDTPYPIPGGTNEDRYPLMEPFIVSGLDCSGTLSWTGVTPGETVTGSFTVENIGGPGTLLDWEVESYPDWGTWSFDPDSGTGLEEGDTATINVEVVAPDEPEETFTGEVVLVNSEDPDDICIIDVSLATPVSQQVTNPLLQMILERFPNAFPILRYLLGL